MIKLPFIGSYLSFFLNPLGYFEMMSKNYSDVATADFGFLGKSYYLFNPDYIEKFFNDGKRLHRKELNRLFGDGLFTLEAGQQSEQQRAELKKCFNTASLEYIISVIQSRAKQFFLKCSTYEGGVSLTAIAKPFVRSLQLALVIGPMSANDESEYLDCIEILINYLNREFTSIFRVPAHWPTPTNLRFHQSLRKLKKLIKQRMSSLLTDSAYQKCNSILASLLKSTDSNCLYHRDLICEEVLTLLIAGTETSTAIVIWMLYMMSNHIDVQSRLRSDINKFCRDSITVKDLVNLSYARNVVQETLRLYPPAWAMIRFHERPFNVNDVEVPAGSMVWVFPCITHKDPNHWDRPDEYLPERFDSGNHLSWKRSAYFPFALGGHRCIAERFVMTQAQIIASFAAKDFTLISMSPLNIRPKIGIALLPSSSPRVAFKNVNNGK